MDIHICPYPPYTDFYVLIDRDITDKQTHGKHVDASYLRLLIATVSGYIKISTRKRPISKSD